jgi:hypothetical protein
VTAVSRIASSREPSWGAHCLAVRHSSISASNTKPLCNNLRPFLQTYHVTNCTAHWRYQLSSYPATYMPISGHSICPPTTVPSTRAARRNILVISYTRTFAGILPLLPVLFDLHLSSYYYKLKFTPTPKSSSSPIYF